MATLYVLLPILVAPLTVLALDLTGGLSAEDCLARGFRKPDLICSSCRILSNFDLDSLKEDCNKCCVQTEERGTAKRYPRAVLEVCACKFGHMPQIEAFCRGPKPKQFPNLTIKYLRGADPIIKLYDENGEVQEELSIKKWDTDTIEEFLFEHLSP
uniref:Selenoprotein F n=1 Tax=Amblyomma tuberculatum TaxID=48802 RepID=A0A6M2E6U8_9ACAR